MRKKIDEIDEKLLVLFKERLEVSKQIGILKKKYKMNIFDPEREKQIISEATEHMPDNERKYTDLYEVTETEIDNFKSYMLENSIEGVNITVPYKKVFLDKLDFISDEAKAIGAINLLYIKDNKFYGDNTDYYGFKQTLISNKIEPSGIQLLLECILILKIIL